MNKFRIKMAIMAAAMLLMTSNIVNGLYGTIATQKAFSSISPNLLIMVITLPFMVNMVFSILAGPIAKIISKKITTLAGIAIILLAGVVALFFGKTDFNYLLTSSALFGVGQGLLSTLTMALPADYFEGQERASLMGLQSSFVNFGGMLLAFVAALLSGIDWIYAYLVTFAAVPIFIVVMANLPKKEPSKDISEVSAETQVAQEKGKFSSFVIVVMIIDVIYGAFMFTFSANFSLYMTANALGTVTTAGLVQTIMSALGGIAGILYGRMFKTMKSQLPTLGMVITAIGMIQMVIFGGLVNVFIAAVLSGFALTCSIPTFFYNVSNNVSPSMATIALGILNGVGALAIFLSPNIVSAVTSIFMSEPTIEGKMIVSAVVLLALAVVSFFVFRKSDKKTQA